MKVTCLAQYLEIINYRNMYNMQYVGNSFVQLCNQSRRFVIEHSQQILHCMNSESNEGDCCVQELDVSSIFGLTVVTNVPMLVQFSEKKSRRLIHFEVMATSSLYDFFVTLIFLTKPIFWGI